MAYGSGITYSTAHKRERKRRQAAYRQGLIVQCAICDRPLPAPGTVSMRRVVLAHNADRTGWLPGLCHSGCNSGQAHILAGERMIEAAGKPDVKPAKDHPADPRYRECVTAEDKLMGLVCTHYPAPPGDGVPHQMGRCWAFRDDAPRRAG